MLHLDAPGFVPSVHALHSRFQFLPAKYLSDWDSDESKLHRSVCWDVDKRPSRLRKVYPIRKVYSLHGASFATGITFLGQWHAQSRRPSQAAVHRQPDAAVSWNCCGSRST